jgi:hypothetical protein
MSLRNRPLIANARNLLWMQMFRVRRRRSQQYKEAWGVTCHTLSPSSFVSEVGNGSTYQSAAMDYIGECSFRMRTMRLPLRSPIDSCAD